MAGNENQCPHRTKGHSPLSFFIFSAIKLQLKACDRSLTPFYCNHADLSSTGQIQQENKSQPGNSCAGIMHWDCIWPHQRDDTKMPLQEFLIPWEIATAGLDLLCCWILSLCPGSEQSGWGALHTPQVRTFLLLQQGDSRWILHAGLNPDFLCIPPKARPQGGIGTPTQELDVSEAWQKFSIFF